MLSNSSGFSCSYICVSDRIQQGCLTVVNVTHYSNNRRTRLQILFLVLEGFDSFLFQIFFLFINCTDCNLDSHFISQKLNRVLIEILILVCHYPHLHEGHNSLGEGCLCLLNKTCHCNRTVYEHCSCFKFNFRYFRLFNLRSVLMSLLSFLFFKGLRSRLS